MAGVRGVGIDSRISAALRICLLAPPPHMQIFHCWVENSENNYSSTTAPKNKKFAFLTALHIQATTRSIFIKFGSSRDLRRDTEGQGCAPPRAGSAGAVLGQQHPVGDKDVKHLSHSLHKSVQVQAFRIYLCKGRKFKVKVVFFFFINYYFSH